MNGLSERFRRSAIAERRRLQERRDGLREKLDPIEARLAELESLTLDEPPDRPGLGGRMLGDVAVGVLREKGGGGPIHYRDWLALIVSEGHSVSGKRPEAVLLGQVRRDPRVRASAERGIYYLAEVGS